MSSMPNGQEHQPCVKQTDGSKQDKCLHLPSISTPADIHKAPVSRVYSRDYSKIQEKDDTDTISPYLGNPLRW